MKKYITYSQIAGLFFLLPYQLLAQEITRKATEYQYESGYASAFYAISPDQAIVAVNGKLVLAGSTNGDWAKISNTAITGVSPFVSKFDTCFLFTASEKNRSYIARNDNNFSQESTVLEELPVGLYNIKALNGKYVYIYGSSQGAGVIYRYSDTGIKPIFRSPNPIADVAILTNGNIYAASDSVVYLIMSNDFSVSSKVVFETTSAIEGIAIDKIDKVFVSTKKGVVSYKMNEESARQHFTSVTEYGPLEIIEDKLLVLDRISNRICKYQIGLPRSTKLVGGNNNSNLLPASSKKEIEAFILNSEIENKAVSAPSYSLEQRATGLEEIEKLLNKSTKRTQAHRIAIEAERLNESVRRLNDFGIDKRPLSIGINRQNYNDVETGINRLNTRTLQYLTEASKSDINSLEIQKLQQHLVNTNQSLLNLNKEVESMNFDYEKIPYYQRKRKKAKVGKVFTLIPGILIPIIALGVVGPTYFNNLRLRDIYNNPDNFYRYDDQDRIELESDLKKNRTILAASYGIGLSLISFSFFIRHKKYKRLTAETINTLSDRSERIKIEPSFRVGYTFSGASFKIEF